MADVGDMIARLLLDSSGWAQGMQQAQAETAKSTAKIEGAFDAMSNALGAVGAAAGGLKIADQMIDIASAAVRAAEAEDVFEQSLIALNGAGADTAALFQQIQDMELSSPFGMEDVEDGTKRLLAMGLTAEETARGIRAITDTVANMKGGKENIDAISNALAKMEGTGKVTMKQIAELKAQGVPIIEGLAQHLGVSLPEASKRLADGMVDAHDVVIAAFEGMEAKHGGAAERMTGTWRGFLNVMGNMTDNVFEEIGHTILDALNSAAQALKPVMESMKKAIQGAIDIWKSMPEPVRQAAVTFGIIVPVLTGLALAFVGIKVAVAAALPLILPFVTMALPFVGWAVAIGAVVAALVALGIWVGKHWTEIKEAFFKAWDGLEKIWKAYWEAIVNTVALVWDGIKAYYQATWGWLIDIFLEIWDAVFGYFKEKWTEIRNYLTAVWEAIKIVGGAAWNSITKVVSEAWNQVVSDFKESWEQIKGQFAAAWKWIEDHMPTSLKKFFEEFGRIWQKFGGQVKEGAQQVQDAGAGLKEGIAATNAALEQGAAATEKSGKATDEYGKQIVSLQENMKALGVEDLKLRKSLHETAVATLKSYKDLTDAGKITFDSKQYAELQQAVTNTAKAMNEAGKLVAANEKELEAARKKAADEEKKREKDREDAAKKILEQHENQLKVVQALNELWVEQAKKVSTVTGTYSILFTRFGAFFADLKRNQDAFKGLGLEETQGSLELAAVSAKGFVAVLAEGLASGATKSADWVAAVAKMEEAYAKLADYIKKNNVSEMLFNLPAIRKSAETSALLIRTAIDSAVKQTEQVSEAWKSVGSMSKQESEAAIARSREFEKIVTQGSKEGARVRLEAELNTLKLLEAANKAYGDKFTAEQRARMKNLEKELAKDLEAQKKIWDQFFKDLENIGKNFFQQVFERLILGGDDTNKRLAEEEADLRKSLEERAAEWEKYTGEVGKKQDKLTADYEAALLEEDKSLSESLAERDQEFAEFTAETLGNIEEITEKHRKAAEEETQDALDALEEREQDYADYAEEVAENIAEIREKYARELEEETEKLADELADRLEKYEDFVADTLTARKRLTEDTADNIEEETEDTKRNIDDRTLDYTRYAEDTAKKIAAVRLKNKGVYSEEEADLEASLRRKKEDLDVYVRRQQEDLARYTREQQERQAREEQDLQTSLDRKTREHQEYLAQNAEDLEEAHRDYKEGLDKDVGKQQESLEERGRDLETFRSDTAEKIEGIRTKHQEAMDAEVLAQKTALDKERAEYDQFTTDAIAESDERKGAIQKGFEEDTQALHDELVLQRAEYDAFVADITGPGGQLEKLKEQHRTIWKDITDLAIGALESIGSAVARLAAEEVWAALKGQLGGIKTVLGDILGSAKDVQNIPASGGDVAGGVGDVAGSPGSVAAGVAGGLSGWITAISSAVTAISSVIGNFQMAAMNKSLDLIVNHTLRIYNDLAGFKKDAWDRQHDFWTPVKDDIINRLTDIRGHVEHMDQYAWSIDANTITIAGNVDQIKNTTWEIRDDIRTAKDAILGMQNRPLAITVTATGVTTAEAARVMGNQIAVNLSRQLAPTA